MIYAKMIDFVGLEERDGLIKSKWESFDKTKVPSEEMCGGKGGMEFYSEYVELIILSPEMKLELESLRSYVDFIKALVQTRKVKPGYFEKKDELRLIDDFIDRDPELKKIHELPRADKARGVAIKFGFSELTQCERIASLSRKPTDDNWRKEAFESILSQGLLESPQLESPESSFSDYAGWLVKFGRAFHYWD